MANDLTGDFDVVGEFSLPAVNRLLAAMHGIKRFPHSLALRVDDIPQPPNHTRPSVLEIIDLFGDTVVHTGRMDVGDWSPGGSRASTLAFGHLDGIVNVGDAGIFLPPTVPSRLQGRAQLQLSPPTLEIADVAASRISARIQVKARYFADPGSPPASEFAKGEIILTTGVSQITSQAGQVIEIDLRSNAVQASFAPTWSSRVLSAEDRAGIDLLIGNALKSSALPSNNTLPSNIRSMKFKALAGGEPAIAALLNTTSAPGNPASVQHVFLGGSDFAFAVGDDTIKAALQPALDRILQTTIPPVPISIPLVFTSATATYTIKINSATAALQSGRILLTIRGRATSPSWFAPNFDFTMTQAFGLQPDGSTANLVVGDMTLDTSSWIVDLFRGRAMGPMATARDRALMQSGVMPEVRRMLDADRNLGGFLRSLLTPAKPDDQPQPPPLAVSLTYAAAEITPSGIVLRGSLTVADPPPAHVEFAEIPAAGGRIHDPLGSGPEYSGFKSWIPGGTIESYEWKRAGRTQFGLPDERTFVLLPEGPVISSGFEAAAASGPIHAFQPMCLTIRGTRLSSSGGVSLEQVNATYCAFQWFPLLDATVAARERAPLVALIQPGPQGEIEVVGHAPAAREGAAPGTPNLVLHFADVDATSDLQHLADALRRSERADVAAGLVAVLPGGPAARGRYVPGVVYVDYADAEWERLWGVRVERWPATFVLEPGGKVVWQHVGPLDASTLPDTLRRVLVKDRMKRVTTVTPGVRIGHPPPNFLFSYAAGHEFTLRKMAGRAVALVFSRCDAPRSAEAVHAALAEPGWKDAVILAIHDSKSTEAGQKGSADTEPAIVVPDPSGAISRAFGVTAWPTLVFVDARGVVRDVRHGLRRDREYGDRRKS